MTLREKYTKGILALGGCEVKRTAKYIVFKTPTFVSSAGALMYVGKSGAVRIGNNLQWSRPLSQRGKDKLISAGESN